MRQAGQVGQGEAMLLGILEQHQSSQVAERPSCQDTWMLYPKRPFYLLSSEASLCQVVVSAGSGLVREQHLGASDLPSLKVVFLKTFSQPFLLCFIHCEKMPVKLDLGLLQS